MCMMHDDAYFDVDFNFMATANSYRERVGEG